MVTEGHPWWKYVEAAAQAEGTATQRYADFGQYGTLAYQFSGNPLYARKAWAALQVNLVTPPPNTNFVREYFQEVVWMYDWLYPALTPTERAAFIAVLNAWADWCLSINTAPYQGGFRTSDSDQTTAQYFALAFMDIATGPDNPRAGTFLDSTFPDGGKGGPLKPVGGLDATGVNRNTARNTVAQYAQMAAGGEWFESSEYNNGTPVLWLMGIEGVLTATGVEHFPELRTLAAQMALQRIHALSPDLRQPHQWGDEEHPRDLWAAPRMTELGVLAGLEQDDPTVGPIIQGFVREFQNVGAPADPWGFLKQPFPRFFLFYNPYAPAAADWRGALAKCRFAAGQGLAYVHDGWQPQDSFYAAHVPTRTNCDHELQFVGDFQLYRKGEWALTHPISYSTITDSGAGTNTMLIAGLSAMAQRGPVAQEFGPNGEYAYLAGSTRGQYYDQPYYQPPPTFLSEWTRSLFYLPSSNKQSDTVVVFDRVNAQDPRSLSSFSRYRAADQAAINGAPALKQWIIHSPVAPTVTSDGLYWQTAGGQQVQVSTLLPAAQRRTVYDESQLWPTALTPGEKKWQTRIMPDADRPWDTLLNVVQVHDADAAVGNTLIASAGGEVQGALVERAGVSDTLVLFGAQSTSRIVGTGYTVSFTSHTAATDAYLLDLDSTRRWTASIDGAPPTAFLPSSQGVAHLSLSGTGLHTLQIATGEPGTAPPAAPEGLTANAGNGAVDLKWSASRGTTVIGYHVYRSTSSSGYTRQNTQALTTPVFTQSGLTNGTTYSYKVSAVDSLGQESTMSSPVSATPIAPPAPPEGLTATAADAAVNLAWSANSGATVVGYNIYRSTTAASGFAKQNAQPVATLTYRQSGLANGTTYWYQVSTVDGQGQESTPSAPVSATPAAPSLPTAPEGLTASAGDAAVNLNWTAGGANVIGYNVYRSLSASSGFTKQNTQSLTTPTFTETGLANGTTYWYEVTSVDGLGQESTPCSPVSATPMAALYSSQGVVTVNGVAMADVVISDGISTTTTTGDGSYTLGRLAAGTHTLTASKSGYLFTQPQTVTVGPNAAGVNFSGLLKGDLNHNGIIDVGDVQTIVRVVAGKLAANVAEDDLDGNALVDTADVKILKEKLLHGPASAAARRTAGPRVSHTFTLGLGGAEQLTAICFDVDVPYGSILSVHLGRRHKDVEFARSSLPNGKVRILIYSRSGEALPIRKNLVIVRTRGAKKLLLQRASTQSNGADGAVTNGALVGAHLIQHRQ